MGNISKEALPTIKVLFLQFIHPSEVGNGTRIALVTYRWFGKRVVPQVMLTDGKKAVFDVHM